MAAVGMLARFLNGVPAPTRLLLTRAGPVENPRGVLYGHPGLPLSASGRVKMRALGRILSEDKPVLVVAADSRAEAEAARLLAKLLNAPLELNQELRERSWGKWEGLTFTEIRKGWPDEVAAWKRDEEGFAPPGGESLRNVATRTAPAIRRLLTEHAGRTLLLVGNCTVNRVALRLALPFLPLDEGLRLEQNYAELTELRFYGQDGVLIRLNERPVLESS